MSTDEFFLALLVGLGATLILDIWATLLKIIARVQPTNWCVVGRWFCYMPSGAFTHANIMQASSKPFECAVGWIAHYLIGAIYGVILVAIVSSEWLAMPTLVPALLFGLATMFFPLFVMQPSFGFGIASSKVPEPLVPRLKTLMGHTVFGVGMFLSALAIKLIGAA